MKRLFGVLLAVLLSLSIVSGAWAVGTASVTDVKKVYVLTQVKRVVITITWVDDNAGTTLAINPATYQIQGWYLYSAETNPSNVTAPTDNYDITLIDADGLDIAGGVLMNRDTANTELVNIGTATHGYPIIRGPFTFTLSGNAVVGGTGTCILTFVSD